MTYKEWTTSTSWLTELDDAVGHHNSEGDGKKTDHGQNNGHGYARYGDDLVDFCSHVGKLLTRGIAWCKIQQTHRWEKSEEA